jgi:predicted nuclease of predicted toxin-antitoxin system
MILADENTHIEFIHALRKIPLDVLSMKESKRGIQDEEVIKLAKAGSRIILTEDKDFGEWVFAHKIKGLSVIFLRYHFSETSQMVKIVSEMLMSGTGKFHNKFTTITTRKIRSREI